MSQTLVPTRDRLETLLEKLLEKTRTGKILWENLTRISAHVEVRAKIGNGFIRLGYARSIFEEPEVIQNLTEGMLVTLMNANGLLVDRFEIGPDEDAFELAQELYRVASDYARTSNTLIDDMLRSLNGN